VTGNHVFYIPMVLLAGTLLGFVLGRRSAAADFEAQRAREARRQQAREAAGRHPED
jgi:heme exporter protein D